MKKIFKSFGMFMVVGLPLSLVYFSGGTNYLSFEAIKEISTDLIDYAALHPFTASFLSLAIYFIVTLSLLPGLSILDVLLGFLFPQPISTLIAATASTAAALLLFLTARSSMQKYFEEKSGPLITRIREGFAKNESSYLLFLRIIPFFPFGLVSIALSFLPIKTRTFVWTTFLGVIPQAFIYTQAGRGLGEILEQDHITLASLMTPTIMTAFIGLALVCIVPIVYKKIRT